MNRPRLRYPVVIAGIILNLSALQATAQEGAASLPQPLTLEYALTQVEVADPLLQQAEARRARALAEARLADSQTDIDVSLNGRLMWIEPSDIAYDDGPDDHQLSLVARKNLYDFGRSAARRSAAEATSRSVTWQYQNSLLQRRITIMQRFFDVLLADLEFARDNEALAVAFVSLDRLRNRHELGQVSDIALLEKESEYQKVLRQRNISQNRQRATRSRLAIALNRPSQLPAELAMPELSQLERSLPDYELLLNKALSDNPAIRLHQERVNAAQKQIEAARADRHPTINGEVAASEYSREKGSNDKWQAGIVFEVPLYSGARVDASVSRAKATLYEAQAALLEAKNELRQAVLDLWLELQNLKIQRQEAASQQEYRELYLDRSRADYEMEYQTDLGDAMVRLSETELLSKQTDFQIALAWEKLDALTAGPVVTEAVKVE